MSRLKLEGSNNTNLTTLELAYQQLNHQDMVILAEHLNANTHLVALNLNLNHIRDEGARVLATNTTVTSLTVTENAIEDKGAQALAQNTTLRSLRINYNPIGNEGAKAFVYNNHLQTLDVENCVIRPIEAKELAKNSTLISLNIGCNRIGDEGAKAFANNTTLSSLNVRSCRIGNEGAAAFANNETLTSLNLSLNDGIGNEAAKALLANRHLIRLEIHGSSIDKPHLQQLQGSITLNKKAKKLFFIEQVIEIAKCSRPSLVSALRMLPNDLLLVIFSFVALNASLNPKDVTNVCKFLLQNIRTSKKETSQWRLTDGTTTFFKKWDEKELTEVRDRLIRKPPQTSEESTQVSPQKP